MTISDYRKKMLAEINESGSTLDKETASLEALAGDKDGISQLIRVIRDESFSSNEKISAMDRLNAVSVFSPVLPMQMPELVNALRGQMTSPEPEIRYRAFGTLTAMKDEIAQTRLVAELEADKPDDERLVPTSLAISMLGRDEKALPAPLLLKIATTPPDAESLVEAVRHMSADPESFGILKDIMEDDQKPLEARAMIPEMINNVDAPAFLNSAKEMLRSKGSKHELAPFLTKAIAGVREPAAESEVREAKAMIREFMKDSSESFRRLANELLFEKTDSSEMDK